MALSDERRRRKRVALHLPMRLFREPAAESVESVTDNLSSHGFYCVSRKLFHSGERLKCAIVLRCGSLSDSESAVRLECRVTVARVEDLDGAFGLGCHIDDYAFASETRCGGRAVVVPKVHREDVVAAEP